MKPRHALATTTTAVLVALWGLISGVIPDAAGLALLGIQHLAAGISSLAALGHAHLMREAQDGRDRLIFGAVTLLAFTILAIAFAATWNTWGPVLLVALLLMVVLAILRVMHKPKGATP